LTLKRWQRSQNGNGGVQRWRIVIGFEYPWSISNLDIVKWRYEVDVFGGWMSEVAQFGGFSKLKVTIPQSILESASLCVFYVLLWLRRNSN